MLWIGLCVAAFVWFLLQGLCIGDMGDDLSYGAYHNYYGGNILYYPRWVVRHWAINNGRAANYLAPLMLHFAPRWLMVAANALVASLYFYFAARCVGKVGAWGRTLAISLLLLTMAWWDSSTVFDVSFNYVWASAFGLGFLYILLRLNSGAVHWRKSVFIMACAFAFVAGQMHEAMSVALSAGIIVYYAIGDRWKAAGKMIKIYAGCFLAGALLCLGSVGTWRRVAADKVADDSVGMILLKSDFYALILLIVIVAYALFRRRELVDKMKSAWGILAVAAMASMCFSAVGGIVGRSGWFAQTFALMALIGCFWPATVGKAMKAGVCAISALSILCWTAMTNEQMRLGAEAKEAAERYWQSMTGTFYMDHTPFDGAGWWTLMRPRGAVSNSDHYSRYLYEQMYRPDRPYAMLPAADEKLSADSLLRTNAYTIAPRAQQLMLEKPYHGIWRDSLGDVWVEVEATHRGCRLYYSERMELLPGDRLPRGF